MPRSDALRAYLPSRLQQAILSAPAPHPFPPWEERLEGAVLFMDVSGFTGLSEALTRQGPAGTEQLTELLNSFYQRMVAGVELAGGFVARFSGDAITAIFPQTAEGNAFSDALHCGLELINVTHRQPVPTVDNQDFPLLVKVGVSVGRIYAAALGSRQGELRYMVAGRPVQEASYASSFCSRGELMVPSRLEALLPDDVTSLSAPGSHLTVMMAVLRRSTTSVRMALRQEPPGFSIPFERAGRFVPALISERVRLGLSNLVAEHRPVTVLFCAFEGVEFDHPQVGPGIQAFLDEVFERVTYFGGTIDKIEQADKGNVIMALFGAPRALERHEEAAVACAVDLRERFGAGHLLRLTHFGINSGLVYAGNVGAPWRYDYTVMGDVVNLASRLMSSSEQAEILVTARVQSRLSEWRFGPSRLQSFKGKSEQVAIFPVEGRPLLRDDDGDEVIELPNRGELLVGRVQEQERLLEAIERLRRGEPSMVIIEGDVGVGKTRLAAHVIEQVFTFGRVLQQRFRPVVSVPYGYWQWSLLELLGGSTQDLDARLRTACLDVDKGTEPWLAVFNPLLGTHFPESPLYQQADQRSRERKLIELAAGLLLAASHQTPLLIVLEDFHEADSSSLALLRYLASQLEKRALMFLIVSRPSPVLATLEGLPGYLRITLQPFQRETLVDFVEALAGEKVHNSLAELVWTHSQGNALFAEELWLTLKHSGRLKRIAGCIGLNADTLEIPDSLRALLQSRLDDLSEVNRAIVKVAAAIGQRFSLSVLESLFSDDLMPGELQDHMEALIAARIVIPGAQRDSFEFRHVLSREVVYNSLTRAQQADMHRRIGDWLERKEVGVSPAVLAHHFELGGDYSRAIQYHLQAAIEAERAFSNREALEGFQRVLALAEEQWKPLPEGTSRVQILETIADIHFRVGDTGDAVNLYKRVRTMAPDWLTSVRCLRKEADSRVRQDDIPNALRCAQEALLLLKGERGWTFFSVTVPMAFRFLRDLYSGPPEKAGAPIQDAERPRLIELDLVYGVMALALYYEGSHNLIEIIHRMCELALRLGEPGRIARAFASISFLYASLAFFGLSDKYSSAAIMWLEKAGDTALTVQMRGTIAYALAGAGRRIAGDWANAEALLQNGISLNQSIGDVWEEGLGLVNLALLWRARGFHHKAIQLHARILAIGNQRDQHLGIGEALVCDGLCLAELGRFEEAQARIDRALSLAGVNTLLRVRAIAYRGWLKYLQGRLQPALSDMNEAARLIQRKGLAGEHVSEIRVWIAEVQVACGVPHWKVVYSLGRANMAVRRLPTLKGALSLVRGQLAVRQGKPARALAFFEQAVTQFQAAGRLREMARALRWQASVQPARASALRLEALRLLKECGLPEQLPGAPA